MTYLMILILLGFLIVQFVWLKPATKTKTLILPIIFSVIIIIFIIFKLDFGNMLFPFVITGILLWALFIWKLFKYN